MKDSKSSLIKNVKKFKFGKGYKYKRRRALKGKIINRDSLN